MAECERIDKEKKKRSMYQELSRKELQTLCKQQGIPANKSNAFMAQSLAALASVSFLIFFSWVLYFSFRGRRERGGVVGEREREGVCVCVGLIAPV